MSRLDRLERLDAVLQLLRDRPGITAAELGDRLGTSTRNVFRDVALLRDRGYPVESSRGRGGGLRLHPSWGLGRVPFSAEEGLSTLLGLAIAEGLGLPLFSAEVRRARTLLVGTFPAGQRQPLARLRQRILVGPPASAQVRSSYGRADPAAMEALQSAFVRERVSELEYRKADGESSTRRVEPHAILLNWPAWYLLTYDRLRSDVRTFRLDRVTAARVQAESFRPRPRQVWEAIGAAECFDVDRWSL